MPNLRDSLKGAQRLFLHAPGFSAAVTLTIALGIGATTAIFSVFHAVLLDPLPYHAPDRLVAVWETDEGGGDLRNPVSSGNYMDWRDRNEVFESIGAYSWNWPLTLTGAGTPVHITAIRATPSVFETLGVAPALGQPLDAKNLQQTDESWIAISHGFWESHFGADSNVVGRAVKLEDSMARVAAVMPASFDFPNPQVQLWVPVRFDEEDRQARESHQWRVVGRLKADVTIFRAGQQMRGLAAGIAKQYPAEMEGFSTNVVSLHDDIVRHAEPVLWILLTVVGLTLLIACANAAGLMFARLVGKRHELAVRGALGAGRARIAGHVMVECLALGLIGSAFGVLFAVFGIQALVAVGPAEIPRLEQAGLNLPVLAFSQVAALATVLVVGFPPALRAARTDPAKALAAGVRVGGGRTLAARRALIVVELALACVLTIGAGLLVHSFVKLMNVDPGFRTDGLQLAGVSLPYSRYPENPEQLRFYDDAIRQLAGVPGVEAVAGTPEPSLIGPNNQFSYMVEGRPRPGADPREDPISLRAVTPTYFRTAGIELLSGRAFNEGDRADAARAMIVNEAFARRHWPDGQAVGKRVTRKGPEGPWWEIVGVVKDTRHFGLDTATPPAMYIPFNQKPWSWMSWMTFVIRHEPGRPVPAQAIREAIWRVDDQVAVSEIHSIERLLEDSSAKSRFATMLLVGFGMVATILSLVGIFGVLSYTVLQRTGEFGLRMALGADRAAVATQIVAAGAKLAAVGLGLGLIGALAFAQALKSQLFQVSAIDPLTFLAAPVLLFAAALAAGAIPALRAGRTSPAEALRYE